MLISGQVVYGSSVEGTDAARAGLATLGSIQDMYFDDESWQIKHVAVDVGGWLEDHCVLFPPSLVRRQDWVERRVWISVGDGGKHSSAAEADLEKDTHLHSSRRTTGYRVEAYDGEVGVVKDVIVDDQSGDVPSHDESSREWRIRYLVVDARSWLADRFVLISPQWTDWLAWNVHKIRITLLRETIRHSPRYDPFLPIGRAYEEMLHDYYDMPKYWDRRPV